MYLRLKKILFLTFSNPELFVILCLGKIRVFFAKLHLVDVTRDVMFGDVLFRFNKTRLLHQAEILEKETKSYELAIVHTMRKRLMAGDIFIDIGANIGYLTVVGAHCVGTTGEVHSFEPAPEYFQDLKMIRELNPSYSIFINQNALGDREEMLPMTVTLPPYIGNSTFVPGVLDNIMEKNIVTVPVIRLDTYLMNKNITPDRICMIKIDVEGFELPVLRGLSEFFKSTPHRPCIICEIRPLAYVTSGFSIEELLSYMQSHGYHPYDIESPKRLLTLADLNSRDTNVLFTPF